MGMYEGLSRLERLTLTFWELSLACHGDPRYAKGQTFKSAIERLHPLRIQGEFPKIYQAAEELVDMLVHDRLERPRLSEPGVCYSLPRSEGLNPCSEIILPVVLEQRY